MRVEYAVALAVILLAGFLRFQVNAQSASIYNVSFDESGAAIYSEVKLDLPEAESTEEYAAALLKALFDKKHSPNFAPPGTQILTLIINDNHLILNLSKDILAFGEDYYRNCIRRQIVKTLVEIPGVDTVTVLVDNGHYFRFEKAKNKEKR